MHGTKCNWHRGKASLLGSFIESLMPMGSFVTFLLIYSEILNIKYIYKS